MNRIALTQDAFSDPPELDTAVSHATLRAVAGQQLPDLFRIHIPARIVAFGRQDTHAAGYAEAVASCLPNGFTPVLRLAGGRAAVFHENTIAFSWQTRTTEPKLGIADRFEFIAERFVDAFARLGIQAQVGEVPGEYCPGRYSIHVNGKKVVGVGQRLVAGAAHVGGVVVVKDAASVNQALEPVYRALDLRWDPAATGALSDVESVTTDDVTSAILSAMDSHLDSQISLPRWIAEEAIDRAHTHRPDAS